MITRLFLLYLAGSLFFTPRWVVAASTDLFQARNGSPASPTDPVDWVKGNVGSANSHYIEGYSIPYRIAMSGLGAGSHRLIIEWDVTQSGKHAVDYLTHYNRLLPHNYFPGHAQPERIDVLSGLSGSFAGPQTFPIPAPSSAGSPILGLPTTSFNSLPSAERVMTIWNGTITNVSYLSEGNPSVAAASTQMLIEFTSGAGSTGTVVIAFGGHIATSLDWGTNNSATGISGSSYHLRLVSMDGGGGNQDRSLQATAVMFAPSCSILGPAIVCAGSINTYSVVTDATGASYGWSLANNSGGATIVGPTNGSTVQIQAGTGPLFSVQLNITPTGNLSTSSKCQTDVRVNARTTSTPLQDQKVCPRSTVTFATTPSGTGPFSFAWRKDGTLIDGATSSSISIPNVSDTAAGNYCVEVTGACNSVTNCARLTLIPAPVITCPANLQVQCLADVPAPAPGAVMASTESAGVVVSFVGDTVTTNGCDIIVTRSYKATDSCGTETLCAQTITVRDTLAPQLTCPPARVVEVGLDWHFDWPTASDTCDGTNVLISVFQTVTNRLCGSSYSATRTWTATDRCQNSATCSQMVTIVDTQPPVIICSGPKTIEFGNAWDFDAPTSSDIGDGTNVTIKVTETVTNALIGTLFSAKRTWTAMDGCGNSATCSQIVTLLDTTAPQITCSTNITVVCEGPPGASVGFTVTASDIADHTVQPVCTPTSGSVFSLGATTVNCVATDLSGNQSSCSFTVTVVDVEPPVITCPANIVVSEDPVGSGHAVVPYPAATAIDNCDPHPTISYLPAPGSLLSVGDNRIECTARDASGNSKTCSFIIRVVAQTISVSSTDDSGPGTLRQALLDANAVAGTNIINFAFPGGPPYVIRLLSPLPPISDSTFIDGWSQLEFQGVPVVQVDGTGVPPVPAVPAGIDGLIVTGGNTSIRGLVLNGFAVGIRLGGPGSNVVQGNFIGTDRTGMIGLSNAADGIVVTSGHNLIGGTNPGERNIISANGGHGIVFEGTDANGNTLLGNFIGLAGDGITPLGNGGDGVMIRGGAARNHIGPANAIAYNKGRGVVLEALAGNGNDIRANSIRVNGGLGIDLGADGPTPNDPGDADAGPNALQNFPILTRASTFLGTVTVDGTLNSASNRVYQLDFFVSPTTNMGPAVTFLGSASLTLKTNQSATFSFRFTALVPPDQFITATATDPAGNTSEFSPPIRAGSPPFILVQPTGTNIAPGLSATFCVVADGSRPLRFQWRHNGANIPDETNACFTIPNVQIPDGGAYTVLVANEQDAVLSDEAMLTLDLPGVPAGDNFADRVLLVRTNGVAAGNNFSATREPGEPQHAGKPGGKSVWYKWRAPATGIARFRTIGSTFDTLLAIYQGNSFSNLVAIGNDEDRGGYFTSDALFNAFAGTEYQIAIDGYGNDAGTFVFSWEFEPTDDLLPVILTQSADQTVGFGSNCTFTVSAIGICLNGRDCGRKNEQPHHDDEVHLSYQWYFNGVAISNATQPTLTITNVQPNKLGNYAVVVSTPDRSLASRTASLQINSSGALVQNVEAFDKFLDAADGASLQIGTFLQGLGSNDALQADPNEPPKAMAAAGTVVSGFTGTQVFNTSSNTTSRTENICGVIGGASAWVSLTPHQSGTLFINTAGSTFPTVMAVFKRSPVDGTLQQVDCNVGTNFVSAVAVPVQAEGTNFVLVDGVNGARGVLKLNYSLVAPSALTALGVTLTGESSLRVTGYSGMRFSIERSQNLSSWTPLIITNSATGVFDFTDKTATNSRSFFYRASMIPF
jgi:hypothetical protein